MANSRRHRGPGPVLDISLNGVRVGAEPGSDCGASCEVRTELGDDPEQSIVGHGSVARRSDQGVAIRFEAMELDRAAHLRRLVTFNSEDPVQAEPEAASLRLTPDNPSTG